MTTLIGYDKPTLEQALEHHGVKGQKWGVRKENAVAGHNVRVAAKQDLKTTRALQKASHKGVVAERKAHRDAVKAKAANSPAYAKAQKTMARRETGKRFAKSVLKTYAYLKLIDLVLVGGASHSTRSRGASFVSGNPGMMNAKYSNGAFNVTTL